LLGDDGYRAICAVYQKSTTLQSLCGLTAGATSVDLSIGPMRGEGNVKLFLLELEKGVTTGSLDTITLPAGAPLPICAIRRGEITELDLSNKGLQLPDALILAAAFKAVPDGSLLTLLLASNRITAKGAAALASCRSVHSLNVADNDLGPKEAARLARALKAPSSSLGSLDLSHNRIGDAGAAALAEVLEVPGIERSLTRLSTLDVSYNGIGADGAAALAEALKVPHSALRTLGLTGNRIGPAGAAALAEALVSSGSLHTLNVSCGDVGAAGAAALAAALERVAVDFGPDLHQGS